MKQRILYYESKNVRKENMAIGKISGIKQIQRGEELEREWPFLEAVHLQATTFVGCM